MENIISQCDVSDVFNLNFLFDFIYLDPPFLTQRTFDMKDGDSFSDKWHNEDQYYSWILAVIERLFDERLKNNGTLYVHNNTKINAEILARTKIKKRYITTIHWLRSHPHNNIKNNWGNIVDTILMFGKGKPFFVPQYLPLDKTYSEKSFFQKDAVGSFALAPITGEKSRMGKIFEYNGVSPKYGWRLNLNKIEELDKKGLIYWGKNKPYKKIYAKESKGRPIQNFWNDIPNITRTEKNKREYPTQKPVKLIKRLISSSCPENGTILDPFSGGGTSLRAMLELNDELGYNRTGMFSDSNPEAFKHLQKLNIGRDVEIYTP